MTANERRLVAALLRCAADSGMHQVLGDLRILGRLTRAAWVELYRAGGDRMRAAAAMDAADPEVTRLTAELATRDLELLNAQRELADAHEYIRLSHTRAVAS